MITRRLLEAPDGRGWVFLGILLAAAIVVPCLNILVPPDSPFHITTTTLALWGQYLCFALLALPLDLLCGSSGSPPLGHGVEDRLERHQKPSARRSSRAPAATGSGAAPGVPVNDCRAGMTSEANRRMFCSASSYGIPA